MNTVTLNGIAVEAPKGSLFIACDPAIAKEGGCDMLIYKGRIIVCGIESQTGTPVFLTEVFNTARGCEEIRGGTFEQCLAFVEQNPVKDRPA